jgi:hypothetical protein
MVHGRSDGYHQSSLTVTSSRPENERVESLDANSTTSCRRQRDDEAATELRRLHVLPGKIGKGLQQVLDDGEAAKSKGDDARWAICGGGHEIRRLGVMLGFEQHQRRSQLCGKV